jgi:hypothetical protein
MKLNCKPGDLAYVVNSGVQTPGLAGRFVVVERFASGIECIDGLRFVTGYASWVCRAAGGGNLPAMGLLDGQIVNVERRVIEDAILRPIRDPGDDAQDESLSWLPVPSREEVAV